jgi:hypothetical protein
MTVRLGGVPVVCVSWVSEGVGASRPQYVAVGPAVSVRVHVATVAVG